MASDYQREREQAHALLDRLPCAKLGAVRSLLEVMIDDDELTVEDRAAIQAGLDSLDKNGGIVMEGSPRGFRFDGGRLREAARRLGPTPRHEAEWLDQFLVFYRPVVGPPILAAAALSRKHTGPKGFPKVSVS